MSWRERLARMEYREMSRSTRFMLRLRRTGLRRGSAYLLILMVSMIVSMIGLSSVMISRIQMRTTVSTNDSSQARVMASSAVDLALFTMVNDSSWRTNFTNNTWSAERNLGQGSIAFKFVDESDASLSAGVAGPVRVYGRGTVGQTVQMCSTFVGSVGPNLLLNADMEDTSDTTNWVSTNATLVYNTTNQHAGSACLFCKLRTSDGSGPSQDVNASITNGGTYSTEVWIWSWDSGLKDYRIEFRVTNDSGKKASFKFDATIPAGKWTKVSATFTPTWTGNAALIEWKVRSLAHTSWFYIDDAQLTELTPAIEPLAGSWRQEVN